MASALEPRPRPLDQMPGLATDEEMQDLREAKGTSADALFLELMATHHRGGIHMAEYAYHHASSRSVRDVAQLMAYVQATVINEVRDTAQRNGIPAVIAPQQVSVANPAGGT